MLADKQQRYIDRSQDQPDPEPTYDDFGNQVKPKLGTRIPKTTNFKNNDDGRDLEVNYVSVYRAVVDGNRAIGREDYVGAEVSFGMARFLVGTHDDNRHDFGKDGQGVYFDPEPLAAARRWLGSAPGAPGGPLEDYSWPEVQYGTDGSAVLPGSERLNISLATASGASIPLTTWDAQLFALKHVYLDLLVGELLTLQRRYEEAISGCYDPVLACPFVNAVLERGYARLRRAQACQAYGDDLYARGQQELAFLQYGRALASYPELTGILFRHPAPIPHPDPADPSDPAVIRQVIDQLTVDLSSDMSHDAAFNPEVLLCLRRCAQALLQIKSGYNYLGYREDFVPPWRFEYLLQQARYFADHARQGERDYLNFREKAEAEQDKKRQLFQHLATQTAQIGIQRLQVQEVRQAVDEIEVRIDGLVEQRNQLVELKQKSDAQTEFNSWCSLASSLYSTGIGAALLAAGDVGAASSVTSGYVGLIQAAGSLGFFGPDTPANLIGINVPSAVDVQDARFDLQGRELDAAIDTAIAEQRKATTAVAIAEQNLQLAQLAQHQIQSDLDYLARRPLNEEFWLGLARQIRGNARRYLRAAIELAYLTQLAYDFEAERRLRLIKFDYGSSPFGDVLGGDYLLGDLDTIAAESITSRRQKELPVKYSISLAEKDPLGFAELRRTGRIRFQTAIPELDLAFPGLYRARVKNVEVLVQALVGPAGVRGRLTTSGYSLTRLKSPDDPGELSTENVPPDWLLSLRIAAAAQNGTLATFTTGSPHGFAAGERVLVSGMVPDGYNGLMTVTDVPDLRTFIVSTTATLGAATELGTVMGLHGGDFRIHGHFKDAETMVLSQYALREDGALLAPPPEALRVFEGMGAAAAWQLDLPRASNTFDFNTLLDVRVVFYLIGYYDDRLRQAVEAKLAALAEDNEALLHRRRTFSLRFGFPDAWYGLLNPSPDSGTLQASFGIRDGMFPSNEVDRRVRQLAVYFAFDQPLPADAVVPFTLTFGNVGANLTAATDMSTQPPLPDDPSAKMFSTPLTDQADPVIKLHDAAPTGSWQLQLEQSALEGLGLTTANLSDIFLSIVYRYDIPA